MGLFDFPRIHFSGDIDVNVPTINNAYYFPLTLYDATRSEAYLPPRLYFSKKEIITAVKPSISPTIYKDANNGFWYIEIEPINTIELLRQWCMTPLGSNVQLPDAAYVPYYTAADKDILNQGTTISGCCPGYWNMYGDMSVTMTNVMATGVQTVDEKGIHNWTNTSTDVPAAIQPFLNASFNTNTTPESGISTAVMVETLSSQSVYANVFCSNVNLYNTSNPGEVFLQGTPCRFQALIYGAWRVVNWMPPMAGSGRFCATIPLAEISDAEQSLLVQFFNNYKPLDKRQLKGVFVTFTIFEVFENRYDQNVYSNNAVTIHPAQGTTVGSITPWYDGDMVSNVIGRNLISLNMQPIYQNTNSFPGNTPINCTPPIASLRVLDNGNAVFSVDMGNSWPEFISPAYSSSFKPALRGQATFETATIGTLTFKCADENATAIASIAIDPSVNPRSKVFQTGCLFDFLITDAHLIQTIQSNYINGFLPDGTSSKQVLQESTYMICTDQKGLYSEEGDLPSAGYFVFDHNRIPCRLRIYQKGAPVTTPISVGVAEYIIPEAANDPFGGPDNVTWQEIADNGVIALSSNALNVTNNAIYYFVYQNQYLNNQIPEFNPTNNYTVMDTGSFAVLRVHPKKDYSKYIDPSHPDYTPPTFEVVYNEVFKLYDVVYPAMALIHPFTPEQWDNATMSGLALQRCDPSNWNNILYMSRSRELSSSQLELLKAWNQYLNQPH